MKQIPPDWNEDRRLWEALGKVPEYRAPSNFAYRIRQKLAAESVAKRPWKLPSFSFPSLVRGWVGGLVTVLACLTLLFTWTRHPQPPSMDMELTDLLPEKTEVELAQLAQHYELIQDLEVIEKLDEL